MRKNILLLLTFILLTACGGTSADSPDSKAEKPMTVGALMTEYKNSKEETVKKYGGKTLTVGGITTTAPILPTGATDAGILVIGERGGDPFSNLTCQFTQAEKEEFSKIEADQAVILRGIFDDSISTALKSCKLVKLED